MDSIIIFIAIYYLSIYWFCWPNKFPRWANKPGYLFFSFLPSPPARTRLDSHSTPHAFSHRPHASSPMVWARRPFSVAPPLSSALPYPCYFIIHLRCSRRRPSLASDPGRQAAPAPTVVTSTPLHPLSDGVRHLANPTPICFPQEAIHGRVLLWQQGRIWHVGP